MEGNVCSSMASDTVTVKEEPVWEQVTGSHSVNEAAALAGLYTDHEVKEELVIGPVVLQPPDAVFTADHWDHTYAKTENPKGDVHVKEEAVECLKEEAEWEALAVREQLLPRDCVVRLERSDSLVAPLGTDTCRGARHVDNSANVGSQIHRKTSIVTKEETYVCDICEKRFSMKTQLMQHITIHVHRTKQQESKAGNASAGAGASRGQWGGRGEGREPTRAGEYRYCCEICLHKFPTPSKLKIHERTHTKERPFPCGICKQNFSHLNHLKTHERIHTGERPFRCGTCKHKFAQSSNLKRHERTHTGEKPFSCRICKKKFAQSSTLKKHERTHTGAKPYSCNVCKKQFTQSQSVKKHKDRLHADRTPC